MKYSILVAAAVVAFAASGSARGATIHVPLDQPTIQAGIIAAQAGDTVLVAAGSYIENFSYHQKAITVTSEGGAGVTHLFPAEPGGPTVGMS
jgi:hypothetical protein